MVQRLLGLVIGGCLGCGCLLSNPPDYEDPVDYRPAVVSRSPASQFVSIQTDDPLHYQMAFSLEVWDGNVDQVLQHRWFLDYRPDAVPRCNLVEERREPSGQEVREPLFRLPYEALTAGMCHRLSAVITDGEWADGPGEGCSEAAEGANRIVVDWWIAAYDESTPVDFNSCEVHSGFDP
jgi:hypothetical protein